MPQQDERRDEAQDETWNGNRGGTPGRGTADPGPALAELLDRHAAGAAAAARIGEAVRRSTKPYLCPGSAMAVLRWHAAAGPEPRRPIRFDLFTRAYYVGRNASYTARQLVGQGLVEKWTTPGDRRAATIRLTEAGLRWCGEMAALLDGAGADADRAEPGRAETGRADASRALAA